jgi:hypothetical protein
LLLENITVDKEYDIFPKKYDRLYFHTFCESSIIRVAVRHD